jgi:NlpC/P60 family putative phage cell wall peptidase
VSSKAAFAARGWIGTPYRHRAAVKRAGCDCLGLIRGVWAEIGGPGEFALPPYTPDWGEPDRRECLWAALDAHLVPMVDGLPLPGEVLLFRMRAGAMGKHLGILTEGGLQPSFVHAHAGSGVIESRLSPPWQRRLVARFAFPEGGQ